MELEWDDAKDRASRQKHGFDFTFASRIFNGPVRRFVDPRRWAKSVSWRPGK
jgi:uncharacterized DUF497 family protein